MNRIALLVYYVGTFPKYFPYFVGSAILNTDVDFYIFSDQVSQAKVLDNVKIIPLTLHEFNDLASSKLGIKIQIAHGYKLCDLKPSYGVIFEDYLKSYDFWGHCDLDVLWGKISNFITNDILENFDVITTLETHLAGHFILYRNSGISLNLFRQTDDYKKVFMDGTTNYHFDEACLRYGEFHPPDELRQSGRTVSMSDIAMSLKLQNKLKLYMKKIIRDHPDPIQYIYRNGFFTDLNGGEEFMYLHLSHVKNYWHFYIPPLDQMPSKISKLTVIPGGIIPSLPGELMPKLKWQVSKTLFSLNYLLRRVKQFGLSASLSKLTKKFAG